MAEANSLVTGAIGDGTRFEQQISGVPGASYNLLMQPMQGNSTINVYFDEGLIFNIGQVNGSDRVSLAMPQLPSRSRPRVGVQSSNPPFHPVGLPGGSSDGQFLIAPYSQWA